MSPIAEFTLPNPILQETQEELPEVAIRIEDEYVSSDTSAELVLLASGTTAELERFEELLPADPSVTDHEQLGNFGDSKLVRVTLSADGYRGMTYPIAVTLGITFLDITARGGRMRYRVQVPTLEALSEYRERCLDRDLSFELVNIYQHRSIDGKEYGLTSRQREVLRYALEAGYFEVPRQTTLEDLATEFDVSDQALSALLRRGQAQLLRHTVAEEY